MDGGSWMMVGEWRTEALWRRIATYGRKGWRIEMFVAREAVEVLPEKRPKVLPKKRSKALPEKWPKEPSAK